MELNRRDFIGAGALVATAAIGQRAISFASVLPNSSGQGEWVRSGIIDAGGSHEPYIFVVRRGGQRLDAREKFEYEQSEELIKKLHGQGVDVFHTHLYKGFGMAAEKPDMEDARTVVEIAHRYGMKVDSYVQWNTLMYETFFAEEPRAANWVQRDAAGQPILLPYGYQHSFRYRPCFSNQEYLDYLKRIVHYAVVEVKTDFIHFDNFDLNEEPDSCHCPWCVKGFRKLLRTKYSDEQRLKRFGFANTDFVNPPLWNRGNPPDKLQIIFDPALQEWANYRCQMMADALQQISEYAKSLNPNVVIEINPGGIDGKNRPWAMGIDHPRLLKFTEVMWSEENEKNPTAYHSDGRLVSKIRSYKLARIYNNTLLVHFSGSNVAVAESLAFNQTLGHVGNDPLPSDMLKFITFYRKNKDLYLDSKDVAPVAVLRSYASLTNNNAQCQLSTILIEQALIQSHIPFTLIFDEHLRDLSKYKVLVLPNSECLSDEQISLIRSYVRGGGGIVVTEQSGLYDEWRRTRTTPGLTGLVDRQTAGVDYQEKVVESTDSVLSTVSRTQVGSGRAVYISSVQFDGALPPHEPFFSISTNYWKRPKNSKDIIDAIVWAAGDPLPLGLEVPEFVIANCTYQERQQRVLLHLVNYNALQSPILKDMQARVTLPNNQAASKVTLYKPDSSAPQQLNFTRESSGIKFTVPEMQIYALIAVQS